MDLVVTLVEKDFLYGAAALLNSLSKNGFKGHFVIGIRDETSLPKDLFQKLRANPLANDGIEINFILTTTTLHFANYKPGFMLECLSRYPVVQRILYLDPDIVMTCPWRFVQEWIDSGIALCADVNHWMPDSHPIRHQWRKIIAEENLEIHQSADLYLNSGMLGLTSGAAEFLRRWEKLILTRGGESNPVDGKGSIGEWRKGGRWQRLFSPNQDTLNITAMTWPDDLAIVGPDAMGFVPGDCYFSHAIGSPKPWEKSFLKLLFQGIPPNAADKNYFNSAMAPIPLFTLFHFKIRKIGITLSAFFARFYKRN